MAATGMYSGAGTAAPRLTMEGLFTFCSICSTRS